jgi:hypothetical protein
LHTNAARAKNTKNLSTLHRSNYFRDSNQTLQELSVPFIAVHIGSTFSFAALHKRPGKLKIKKSCPAFTDQTTGGISTKLYRSDQYHPKLWISLACSALLHSMAATAVKEISWLALTGQTIDGISTKLHRSEQYFP